MWVVSPQHLRFVHAEQGVEEEGLEVERNTQTENRFT